MDDQARRDRPARPRRPGHDTLVRIACHLAAGLPIVVVGIRSMATGWLPTSDAAVFAWRARDVLSAHPTLVGAPTHAYGSAHQGFAPGPVLSWLLAVPVHVDPGTGILWGSVLIALAGASVAVEGARAVWAPWGGVLAAGAVVVLLASQTSTVFNPIWTPWLGAVWTIAALAAACAVATGRWRWWPGSVVASSVAAQAHVIFALVVVGACVAGPVVAWWWGRRDPAAGVRAVRRRALSLGVVLGVVLWVPTLIDQLAGHPGNLSVLWAGTRSRGGSLGPALALQGYGAATAPVASWMHRLPTGGAAAFLSTFGTVFGAATWQGVVTLVLLAVVAVVAGRTGRQRLAAAGWIALVAGLASVATMANIPQPDYLELGYVSVVYWPVGILAWLVLVAGAVELVRAAAARSGRHLGAPAWAAGGLVGLALLGSVALATVDARTVPNDLSIGGGTAAATIVRRSAGPAAAAAPRRPFVLALVDRDDRTRYAAYLGLGYALAARGLPVRLPPDIAVGIAARYGAARGMPTVTVTVGGDLRPTVDVTPP